MSCIRRPVAVLLPLIALSGCAAAEKGFDYLKETPVRITEVHFDPAPDEGTVEFIEITNITSQSLDVSGWQVTGAGRLALPAGTTLKPRQALVVVRDAAAFGKKFGSAVKPVAAYSGKLKKKGETIRLEDPQGLVGDEVSYDPAQDPEVEKAVGSGKSLHRVRLAAASGVWMAATPSPGTFVPRKKS